MPDLSVQERLQPSLLDRLSDDEPGNLRESQNQRFFTLAHLRNAVLRDLSWLLNTTQLEETADLDAYPEVRRSVINYGVPSLTGRIGKEVTAEALTRRIAECLTNFEPRLLRDSIRVKLVEHSVEGNATLDFTIEADLWAQPVPLRMFMRTELDRELNAVRVVEEPGRRT